MVDDTVCCRMPASNVASPFEVAMFGWHDGVTSGMARCRSCGQAYWFATVSEDGEGIRVYGFREIGLDSYQAYLRVHTLSVPGPGDVHARSDALALLVRDALSTNEECTLYVAAIDLTEKIIASRRVSFSFWASLLQLGADAD
jgi:hypothetical protein